VTTGDLIREARLRAHLSQEELGHRVGRNRSHIARWERDTVEPGFSTLIEVLNACGFDLSTTLIAFDPGPREALRPLQSLTPAERLDRMLALAANGRPGG
jgi:transcriptional regulator with XRE-family HTH domain